MQQKDTVADFDEEITSEDMSQLNAEIKAETNPGQTVSQPVSQPQEAEEVEELEQIPHQTVSAPPASDQPQIGASTPADDNLSLPEDVSGNKQIEEKAKEFEDKKEAPPVSKPVPIRYVDPIFHRDAKGRITKGTAQDTNKNGTAGRPTVMTQETLEKLRTAFLMGCSDREAALFANINPATLYIYQDKNPDYIEQKEHWKENPILKARATVYLGLDQTQIAAWFLERKAKKEFATRQELTGADGETIDMTLNKLESNYDDVAKKAGAAISGGAVTGETPGQVVAANTPLQDKG